jgi:putative endonuclease
MPRTRAQDAGDAAEALVVERLESLGWTILARNLHVGRHELDVVAVDHGPPAALVAVEVRWRARRDFGLPEETFDWRKRRRMRDAAFGLLDRRGLPNGDPLPHLPLRFDLVLVEPSQGVSAEPRIRHHRNVLGG